MPRYEVGQSVEVFCEDSKRWEAGRVIRRWACVRIPGGQKRYEGEGTSCRVVIEACAKEGQRSYEYDVIGVADFRNNFLTWRVCPRLKGRFDESHLRKSASWWLRPIRPSGLLNPLDVVVVLAISLFVGFVLLKLLQSQ